MEIKKITLNNFKSYYGQNEIIFTKGLNLISGKIGTGKTSLFESIQWLLRTDYEDEQNSVFKSDFLINKKYESESIKNSLKNIECSISMEIIEDSIVYEIRKTANYYLKDNQVYFDKNIINIIYTESRTNNTIVLDDKYDIQYKLDVFFPLNLRKYILFKGEQLDDLIDFSNPSTLSKAIEKISYYPMFVDMENISYSIYKKCEKKYSNKLNEVNRGNTELENISIKLDENDKRIRELEENLKLYNEKISELEISEKSKIEEISIIAGIPELLNNQNQLISKRKEKLTELENQDKKGKQKFIDTWILYKCDEMYNKASDEFQKFKNYRNQQINLIKEQLEIGVPGDHLINKMLHEQKCLICGNDVIPGTKEFKLVESHLDKNKPVYNLNTETEDLNNIVNNLQSNLPHYRSSITSIRESIINFRKETSTIEKDIKVVNEKVTDVTYEIDKIYAEKGINKHIVSNTQTTKSSLFILQTELKTKRAQKYSCEAKINEYKDSLSKLKKRRDEILLKSNSNDSYSSEKLATLATEFITEIIKDKVKNEKKSLLKTIQDEANKIIDDVVSNSKKINNIIIVKVKIDLEDCSVSFTDINGNTTIPHGAQGTLAKLSIISAVLKLTNEYKNESYPFIVDAPASSFDDTIYETYLKSTSDNFIQSIVILKDIDRDIEYYSNADYLSSLYTINKNNIENADMTNSFTVINKIK